MQTKKKPRVVVSAGMQKIVAEWFIAQLGDIADVRVIANWESEKAIREINEAEALIVFSEFVDKRLLDNAPKLRVVSRFGVGYDRVDVDSCTDKGVYVTYTPDVLSSAVAELTIALLLCLSRRIVVADQYVRTKWGDGHTDFLPLRHDIKGKVLGIIGFGRIGYEVALRAKSFGMRISYFDVLRREKIEREFDLKYMTLEELLKTSDYISIHVPLNDETEALIGEKELRLMKRTAYLLNTSRGKVVDEEALCRALKEGWIEGAGIDVYFNEPLPLDSPLIKLENVVLTPHMGTHTFETRKSMVSCVSESVRAALHGGIPLNVVPEQKNMLFRVSTEDRSSQFKQQ